MSAAPPLRVPSAAERLAERHAGRWRSSRLRIRGLAWGLLVLFWVANLSDLDVHLLRGGLILSVLVAGAAEGILRLAYRRHAKAAAAEFNHEFPMGTERDEAVAALRECATREKVSGRAARRLLRALYVPWELPQEAEHEGETFPSAIAIEVAPPAATEGPFRVSPPPLPLQPETAGADREKKKEEG